MRKRYIYKAKRVDNGEWICGSLITGVCYVRESGADIPYILNADESDADCFEDYTEGGEYLEVDPNTICQCTGLKDKNGHLIWENDVVNCPEEECFGVIMWNETECGFYFVVLLEDGRYEEEHIYDYSDCMEAIGNRFDNPELLEV